MRREIVLLTLLTLTCGNGNAQAPQYRTLQAESFFGPTGDWKLDASLKLEDVQLMRDRAYRYCFSEKPADADCVKQQDNSLFEYARSFAVVRMFRSEPQPTFPFASAHKDNPAAFSQIHDYCRAVYRDAGARDARSLGPCMAAGLGADFFSIVPVP